MTTDDKIKQAFFDYGKYLAANMGEGIDPSDDAQIEEAWDEVGESSMLYSESLEHVLNQVDATLGVQLAELRQRLALDDEMKRGWAAGLRDG
jgi:hypothetical protein